MFDFLRAVKATELSNAPLSQVVAQVKFNSQSALSTHGGAIKFQEPLVDEYPRLLAESQAMITAAPGNVSSATIPQWRLTDLAGDRACVVGPDHLTVETKVYSAWPALRERLVTALNALMDVTAPRVRERIGLRYVNHIPPAESGAYTDRVDKSLLGLTEQPGWRDQLAVSVSQVIARDNSTQLTIRYGRGSGVAGMPAQAFVVDIDIADETPTKFDAVSALDYFDELNNCALRCFFAALAEPYRSSLTTEGGA